MIYRKLDCILLVDDDKATNFLNKRLLKKMGVTDCIQIARNGAEGIEYLLKSANDKDGYPWPVFILLDINMPLGNGWEFLEEYEKLSTDINKSTVILMLTTSLRDNDQNRAEKSKIIKGFIKKPLTQAELEGAIEAHFATKEPPTS